jgi:hypothetical protein
MKRGATVIHESTVYPGATEEVCIPVLEQTSGMQWQEDFFVGYSLERINPGDREHMLTNLVKVHRRVRDRQGALGHHLHQVSQAQLVAKVPADAQDDDLALEMPTFEQLVHALHLLGHGTALRSESPGAYWTARFAPEPVIESR